MRTAENFYKPTPTNGIDQKLIQLYGIPQHMIKSFEKLKGSASKPGAGIYSSSIKNH